MPNIRELECYLNDQTLKELIAVHLQAMTVVKSSEDVTNLTISLPNREGVRTIRFNVEPVQHLIQHN